MAAPNIVQMATIRGKSQIANLTTSSSNFLTNASASGQVYKINSLIAINRGTVPADITIQLSKNGTVYFLAYQISVPTKSNLVLLSKDLQYYLEENDILQASASVTNTLVLTCSYETIE